MIHVVLDIKPDIILHWSLGIITLIVHFEPIHYTNNIIDYTDSNYNTVRVDYGVRTTGDILGLFYGFMMEDFSNYRTTGTSIK